MFPTYHKTLMGMKPPPKTSVPPYPKTSQDLCKENQKELKVLTRSPSFSRFQFNG